MNEWMIKSFDYLKYKRYTQVLAVSASSRMMFSSLMFKDIYRFENRSTLI